MVILHSDEPVPQRQLDLGGYAGFSVDMGDPEKEISPTISVRFFVTPEELFHHTEVLNGLVLEAWAETRKKARESWGSAADSCGPIEVDQGLSRTYRTDPESE